MQQQPRLQIHCQQCLWALPMRITSHSPTGTVLNVGCISHWLENATSTDLEEWPCLYTSPIEAYLKCFHPNVGQLATRKKYLNYIQRLILQQLCISRWVWCRPTHTYCNRLYDYKHNSSSNLRQQPNSQLQQFKSYHQIEEKLNKIKYIIYVLACKSNTHTQSMALSNSPAIITMGTERNIK